MVPEPACLSCQLSEYRLTDVLGCRAVPLKLPQRRGDNQTQVSADKFCKCLLRPAVDVVSEE